MTRQEAVNRIKSLTESGNSQSQINRIMTAEKIASSRGGYLSTAGVLYLVRTNLGKASPSQPRENADNALINSVISSSKLNSRQKIQLLQGVI